MGVSTQKINESVKARSNALLKDAVHNSTLISPEGILERMFTMAFKGFVYPQIWEDPEVDLEALRLTPTSRIVTIASGGCNILNYLTENPARITAVDLNPAHIALARLKIAALKHLPVHEDFFRFFGCADDPINIQNYDLYLRTHLDPETLAYWETTKPFAGRRINLFSKNIYAHGLLGRFIGGIHNLARLYGRHPQRMLEAVNQNDQQRIFHEEFEDLFDKSIVKLLFKMPVSMYGLGIPPAQYKDLVAESDGNVSDLLKARMRRLACDFPIADNYFAWQAFSRRYDRTKRKALPRYLQRDHYDQLRSRLDRIDTHLASMTDYLASQPDRSVDGFVLLDAQDWMNADQLNALWREIGRTAAPNAKVIFRTAGTISPLEGEVDPAILSRWSRLDDISQDLSARDRSSIYGAFHLYLHQA